MDALELTHCVHLLSDATWLGAILGDDDSRITRLRETVANAAETMRG
jgi:hypothetical protein